jgi:hypothetical protein
VNGRRVMPDADGWFRANLEPGDYGRSTLRELEGRPAGWWQVCAPDGSQGSLSPSIHTVIEHEDGTITVSPSLDFSKRKSGAWHGWLRAGVWTSC